MGDLERRGDLRGDPRRPVRLERALPSSVPSTQRVAMKTVPFSSPASYSGTTFGWSSAATVLASRRRRSRTTGSAATSGSTTLRATGRLSRS